MTYTLSLNVLFTEQKNSQKHCCMTMTHILDRFEDAQTCNENHDHYASIQEFSSLCLRGDNYD